MAPIWFARDDDGGGSLRPVTWQAWLATGVFLAVLVAAAFLGPQGILLAVLVSAGYIGLIALTRKRT